MKVSDEPVAHPHRSMRFLQLASDGFRGPFHRHPALELTWIEQGHGLRLVGDDASPFEAGDLVLLGPQVPHQWASRGRAQAVATVVQFQPGLLEQPPLPELADAGALLLRVASRGVQVLGSTHATVTARLSAMKTAGELERVALLLQVLAVLASPRADLRPIARARHGLGRTGAGSAGVTSARSGAERVVAWIQRHLAEPLTVAEAARRAHVSPAAFSRFFKREVGRGFADYVNDLRCSQARLLLRHGNRPVGWVAAQCGYTSLSNFHRRFRERTGMTPQAFREAGQ